MHLSTENNAGYLQRVQIFLKPFIGEIFTYKKHPIHRNSLAMVINMHFLCQYIVTGARQFVENHFADRTIGRIRLLVDATFHRVRHLVEKNSQVRHLVEIVKSLFFDQTSYSTERRIYQMSLIIKKMKIIRNHFVYPTYNL